MKKIITLLLGICLIAGVFTACIKEVDKKETSKSTTEEITTENTTEPQTDTSNNVQTQEEKSGYDVILTETGESKVGVIKLIREYTGLGLKEAKDFSESTPKVIKEGVSQEEADEIKLKFEEIGATIEVKGNGAVDIDESSYKPNFMFNSMISDSVTYKVPNEKIVFDRPAAYDSSNFVRVDFFSSDDGVVISFTYEDLMREAGLKSTEVWGKLGEFMLPKVNHEFYGQEDATFEMDYTEEIIINGVDCMKFEGRRIYGEDEGAYDQYAIGYTFVKDGIPCILLGIVVDPEQRDVYINELKNNVDGMMKTIRDE